MVRLWQVTSLLLLLTWGAYAAWVEGVLNRCSETNALNDGMHSRQARATTHYMVMTLASSNAESRGQHSR